MDKRQLGSQDKQAPHGREISGVILKLRWGIAGNALGSGGCLRWVGSSTSTIWCKSVRSIRPAAPLPSAFPLLHLLVWEQKWPAASGVGSGPLDSDELAVTPAFYFYGQSWFHNMAFFHDYFPLCSIFKDEDTSTSNRSSLRQWVWYGVMERHNLYRFLQITMLY